MASSIQHVLWDWHGVLGLEKLWQRPTQCAESVNRFQQQSFSDPALVAAWMRGTTTTEQLLAEFNLPLTRKQLAEQIYAGWPAKSWINTPLFSSVAALLPGRLHSIVTDNVDVFSDYMSADPWVQFHFTTLINSADYGQLKKDPHSLLEVAAHRAGIAPKSLLLLDDSQANCQRMRELGGTAILVPRWTRS